MMARERTGKRDAEGEKSGSGHVASRRACGEGSGPPRTAVLLRGSGWPHSHDQQTDEAIRAYCRTSPIYDARFDFVLVDETGAHLSGCEAFIDRANQTAEIERVCTHADHHNKGYSQMTLTACLRALHENGIPTAYLSGGYDKTIHLYGKLGHVKEVTRFYYEKNLTG